MPASSTSLVTNVGQTIDELRTEVNTAGTLGALEYVLRGIEALPGRKSVVFVSEGFDLGIRDAKVSRTWSAFTRVMDRANRAGVVVYSMDARGLQTGGLTAEDDVQTKKIAMPGDGPADRPRPGRPRARPRRAGASCSTRRTRWSTWPSRPAGSRSSTPTTWSPGMAGCIDDTRGYYLLGFDTSIPTNERWDPNDIRIHVKRPGLTVRARRGLFGPADKERPRAVAPADPLVAATLSPFATGAIDVRLTTLFAHDKTAGSYVRSLFFIDPAGLTFAVGADGRHEADLSLLLLAVGDNGQTSAQIRLQVPLRLEDEDYALLRQRGLLYSARWGSRRPAATRSGPPCRTIARRRSGRAPSSSRCRRSARMSSPCRAS